MSYFKTMGVVLKEVNTGEADRIITVLTKKDGKISCIARGARRGRSRLIAGTQLLSYSDFMLYKGKDLYSVNSCDIIETFYNIRNDMHKLTYAAHILSIVNDVIRENQPSPGVLQLLLNTLYVLSNKDKNPLLVTSIFEMRFLSILGYAPRIKCCSDCGDVNEENFSFSFNKCGIVCSKCYDKNSDVRISSPVLSALIHILYSSSKQLFSFNLSDDCIKELSVLTGRYLNERLEKNYTKLDFLKTLK